MSDICTDPHSFRWTPAYSYSVSFWQYYLAEYECTIQPILFDPNRIYMNRIFDTVLVKMTILGDNLRRMGALSVNMQYREGKICKTNFNSISPTKYSSAHYAIDS